MARTSYPLCAALFRILGRCAVAPREDWKVQSVPTGRGQSISSFVPFAPVGLAENRKPGLTPREAFPGLTPREAFRSAIWFIAIEFTPSDQREEAQAIIELHQREIEGRYGGHLALERHNDIIGMYMEMTR